MDLLLAGAATLGILGGVAEAYAIRKKKGKLAKAGASLLMWGGATAGIAAGAISDDAGMGIGAFFGSFVLAGIATGASYFFIKPKDFMPVSDTRSKTNKHTRSTKQQNTSDVSRHRQIHEHKRINKKSDSSRSQFNKGYAMAGKERQHVKDMKLTQINDNKNSKTTGRSHPTRTRKPTN